MESGDYKMLDLLNKGALGLSPWQLVITTLILTHITIITVTVYLHRSQAHRALDLHPALNHFFRFWAWLTTGMSTRQWVAVHRKHHAKCETPDDPHSPQILGLRKVFWSGAELYKKAARDPEVLQRFGQGAPNDWLEQRLYAGHSNWGPTLMALIDLGLFGLPGLTVWAVQMLWIPFWAAGIINGVGHYWGYRNYEPRDASTNIVPWGLLIGGEELHNNHHAFPTSARLSSKRWEFDLGWCYIQVLQLLRLAKVRRLAPRPQRVLGKQVVDLDTLHAVLLNRFYIMADFGRQVVLPALKEELQRADTSRRAFLKRARAALLREDARLKPQERLRLQNVLGSSQTLRTIYDYRLQLQAVWNRHTINSEKVLAALQDWCAQAEASGIRSLQDFAQALRSYSLRVA